MIHTAVPLLTQCLLALAAFACLCLATPRHIHQLHTTNPHNWRTPLRWSGWVLLTLALVIAIVESGWGLGLVEWFGALTVGAITIVLVATFRATALKATALSSVVLALVGMVVTLARA